VRNARLMAPRRRVALCGLWVALAVCPTWSHTNPAATGDDALCRSAPERRGLWTDAEDNGHLPQGERLAVLITGLSKKRDGEFDVFQHVLQSVKTNVVEAIGADLVDVYLSIEAASNSNVTAQQLAALIASVLPERNVRASILHGR